MEVQIDKEAVVATVEMCSAIMRNMGVAKYSGEHQAAECVIFIKNVAINLLGNFVLEYTDYKHENALHKNIKETFDELQQFFDQVKKIQKGAH